MNARNALGSSVVIAGLVLGTMGLASGQIDCGNPDNLCTGDPCIIQSLEILTGTCMADFGSRTLVIAGTLTVGEFVAGDFSAGDIQINGSVSVREASTVQLTAMGDVVLAGRVRLSPGQIGGPDVYIDATGNVELNGTIIASSSREVGANLDIDSGSVVTVSKRIRADGGIVGLRGTQGIAVEAPIRAAATADGFGGMVSLISSAGGIAINAPISLPPRAGSSVAGILDLNAFGDIEINGRIGASGGFGEVAVKSSAGKIALTDPILARAGTVSLTAAQDITIGSVIDASDLGNKGAGEGLLVEGASVMIGPSARVNVDRPANSFFQNVICLRATAGMVDLAGTFLGRNGFIVGRATGDIAATGVFRVAPDGCVGFSAGGSLVTAGGTFDSLPSQSCVDSAPGYQ